MCYFFFSVICFYNEGFRTPTTHHPQQTKQAETNSLFDRPAHPYTRGLFRSVASLREESGTLETIPGVVPNLLRLPAGCSFSLRCGQCGADCEKNMPELLETEPGHRVRCFLTEKEGAE